MVRLEDKLQEIKEREKIGLMTHVVVGYPSLEETVSLVETMVGNGADMVELQIPFSDPLADGPTIMRACEKSLENGTRVRDAFVVMLELSEKVAAPLLFMAYYNTVFRYGVEAFCRDAAGAGAAGVIVPDMPIDEEAEEHFYAFCQKYELPVIMVVSPASTEDRLKKIGRVAEGFVYCTARQGITGAREALSSDLRGYLEKMRRFFSVPIAVGFGISQREHVEALEGVADVAVVGSAIIDVVNKSGKEEMGANVASFLGKLRGIH